MYFIHPIYLKLRLKKDIKNIINIISNRKESSGSANDNEKAEEKCDPINDCNNGSEGLVIITALVTSCIR